MNENEQVAVTSQRVVSKIARNEMGTIQMELTEQTANQIITGFISVTGQLMSMTGQLAVETAEVASEVVTTLAQIYASELVAAERREIRENQTELSILEACNADLRELRSRIDLSDPNAIKYYQAFSEEILNEMDRKYDAHIKNLKADSHNRIKEKKESGNLSIWEKLFGRRMK